MSGLAFKLRTVHWPSTVEEEIIRLEEEEAVAVVVVGPEETTLLSSLSWKFWLFEVFPVLLAIGISVLVFYLAQQREVAQARDDFDSTAWIIQSNVYLTLQRALESSRLLMGTLLANTDADDFPSVFVFEQMVFSNPFFNMDKTVAKVLLLNGVRSNASRMALPYPVVVVPNMSAAWEGQPRLDAPPSLNYFPVHRVSPPQSDLIGLDLNADPLLGPYIRLARSLGIAVASHLYPLRSGIPGQSKDADGVVYHMPLFQSLTPGVLTNVPSYEMRGVLLAVFWMKGLLERTLKPLELRHTDVFLFDVREPELPTYIAHYETPEEESRPFYCASNLSGVTPFNLDKGDFQTDWLQTPDLPFAQRKYRLLVRGRRGHCTARFSTNLPYILLGLFLGVKALDLLFVHVLRRAI